MAKILYLLAFCFQISFLAQVNISATMDFQPSQQEMCENYKEKCLEESSSENIEILKASSSSFSNLFKYLSNELQKEIKSWTKEMLNIKKVWINSANEGPAIDIHVYFFWKALRYIFIEPMVLNPLNLNIYYHNLHWLKIKVNLFELPYIYQGGYNRLNINIEFMDNPNLITAFEEASKLLWSDEIDLSLVDSYEIAVKDISIGNFTLCEEQCLTMSIETWYGLLRKKNAEFRARKLEIYEKESDFRKKMKKKGRLNLHDLEEESKLDGEDDEIVKIKSEIKILKAKLEEDILEQQQKKKPKPGLRGVLYQLSKGIQATRFGIFKVPLNLTFPLVIRKTERLELTAMLQLGENPPQNTIKILSFEKDINSRYMTLHLEKGDIWGASLFKLGKKWGRFANITLNINGKSINHFQKIAIEK